MNFIDEELVASQREIVDHDQSQGSVDLEEVLVGLNVGDRISSKQSKNLDCAKQMRLHAKKTSKSLT